MLGFSAVSEAPISALLDAQVTVTQTEIVRFATQSFTTRATDEPAHEYISGRLTKGLTLGRRLNSAADGQFGALLEASFGEIELVNADGALDDLVDNYYADGQSIVLKIGATEITSTGREQVQPYADFATVYKSVAGEWSFEQDVVRLRISNLQGRLLDRFQVLTYSGGGGQNGTAEIAGRTLPTALGRCFNVPAQIVDPTILTYQLHAGAMAEVLAVYDKGIVVDIEADYATYTALAAASLTPGTCSTCLAAGFIRLAVAPSGQVTADVRGDIDNVTGLYVEDHSSLIKMALRDYGGLTSNELDTDSFTALSAAAPGNCGLFLPAGDQSSVLDVVERLAFSCGAFAGQDRSGLYRVQRLEAPSAMQHWTFTDREIISIERERLPYNVPWSSWGVGYNRNWLVQTGSELAELVVQERKQFLESQYRYAYVQSPEIALAHLTSAGAPLRESFFIAQSDADTEAQRLIGLYSLGRAMYRIAVKTVLFSVEIGQTVHIIYDRWDLPTHFVVVDINDDADNVSTEMLVFG